MRSIFADTPESQDWFDAIARVSAADIQRVQVPEPEKWREWLRYVEVPEEDLDEVISTTPTPESNAELYEVLQRGAALLISRMGDIDIDFRFAALADFNDAQHRFFYVQLLTACLPFVREYHQSLGIPEHITQATVADLGRNIRVHRKREGIGGLGVMWWLMLHFRGVIFQLGRLQFERQHAGEEVAASMREYGIPAEASSNVLSIHIPDFLGSMDHDSCTESIQQAVTFFVKYFPDWPVETGTCNSWLLDPQLKDYVRADSNIIRFQDRFTLAEGSYDASDSVMQFVFGKHVRDIDTIHPESSLARGVIAHLKSGKAWHGRQGWLRLPSDSMPSTAKQSGE